MVHFKLDGGSSLSDKQIGVISGVLRDKGFENETVIIEPVCKADDNFIADVERFTISKGDETFKMIAKIAINVPHLRNTINTDALFRSEHYMYKEVFPKYQELEKEANIPDNERLRLAVCYDTLIDAPHEIILLEDLREDNFAILDKQDSFSNETVKLVLTNMAKFHSLSHALKHKEPEYYLALINKLSGFEVMSKSDDRAIMVNHLGSQLRAVLKDHKYGELAQQSVLAVVTKDMEKMKISRESAYSVIQHGDAWTNNIMFQTEDGVPTTCCLIDYQLSNCNSTASDLLYMILGSTDYETRSKHFHDWMNFYHEQLDKYLSYHGLRASKVYPMDQLNAELKFDGMVVTGIIIMVSNMVMRNTNEAEKLKQVMNNKASTVEDIIDAFKLSSMEDTSMDRFINRLLGLLKTGEELKFF